MLKQLFIWEDEPRTAAANMAVDEALLHHARDLAIPLLRHYSWTEPAASFGYFQNYAEVETMTHLRPLIRRPTGGGIVPHQADWTYSLVFPPNHPWHRLRAAQSYHLLHQWVRQACHDIGWPVQLAAQAAKTAPGHCFAGPEQFDVLWQERKIAGAAQRRNRLGLLIQGSMQPSSRSDRSAWNQALVNVARHLWRTDIIPWIAPPSFLSRAAALAEAKYQRTDYNQRR